MSKPPLNSTSFFNSHGILWCFTGVFSMTKAALCPRCNSIPKGARVSIAWCWKIWSKAGSKNQELGSIYPAIHEKHIKMHQKHHRTCQLVLCFFWCSSNQSNLCIAWDTWGLPNQIISVVSSVCSPISERHIPYFGHRTWLPQHVWTCGFVFSLLEDNRANNVQQFSTAHVCFRISDLRWQNLAVENASFDLRSFNLGMGLFLSGSQPTNIMLTSLLVAPLLSRRNAVTVYLTTRPRSRLQELRVMFGVWLKLVRTQVASHVTVSWLLNYENCKYTLW